LLKRYHSRLFFRIRNVRSSPVPPNGGNMARKILAS
jgi:hypothetical protein